MATRMHSRRQFNWIRWRPFLAAGIAVGALAAWFLAAPGKPLLLRVPGADQSGAESGLPRSNPVLLGDLTPGPGRAGVSSGQWPQFRGGDRDGTASAQGLAVPWQGGAPGTLWSIEVGEGYGGPAVADGRVLLMDYDREAQRDVLRCLSLDDGREIWRFGYPITLKRNHGMTRTVPAIQGDRVVAIGPKCQVICCDVRTGELQWTRDLSLEFGTTVPDWYTGQCPLIDGTRVILAPGGEDALLVALALADGTVIWRAPNPNGWRMTHSSIMPARLAGRDQYVYCASKGVVGVSADDGSVLWDTTDWKISIATVPSPVVVDDHRLFLTGGYDAGSLLLEVDGVEGGFVATPRWRIEAGIFGATQHTPVLYRGHLYGIRADGSLVCLSLEGRVVWESDSSETFGLGPLLLAEDLIYAMDGSGLLRMVRAAPTGYEKLGEARVLNGRESWGPMALAGTRLLVRDFTRLACLEVGQH